jgi:hypothetical protein
MHKGNAGRTRWLVLFERLLWLMVPHLRAYFGSENGCPRSRTVKMALNGPRSGETV